MVSCLPRSVGRGLCPAPVRATPRGSPRFSGVTAHAVWHGQRPGVARSGHTPRPLPVPRRASACGSRASCVDHGCFSSRASKAKKSSHIETVYLNSRDLAAVSSCLSCSGDRRDHAHCATSNSVSLATEGTVGDFVGKMLYGKICAMRGGVLKVEICCVRNSTSLCFQSSKTSGFCRYLHF